MIAVKPWVKQFVPDVQDIRTVKFGPAAGMKIRLTRRSEWQKELGLYEAECHWVYRKFIKPGSVVLDIGAGIGETAILFAKLVGRNGLVAAFEPCQKDRERLSECVLLNFYPIYISDRVFGNTTGESLNNNPYDALVANTKLDDYAYPGWLRPPTFVKIDVDGSEVDVLQGARRLMSGPIRPVFLVETHSEILEQGCIKIFDQYRYLTRIIPNGWWRVFGLRDRTGFNRWLVAWGERDWGFMD